MAALLASAPALAEYEWVDAAGQKVYSDVPPQPNEKISHLVRRISPSRPVPGAGADGAGERGSPMAAAAPAARTDAAPPSLADREMAFRKRQAEAADAQRKADEKAQADAKLARACEDSRANLRGLESGMRLSRVNSAGEREVITDEEREQRLQQLRRDLADRC